MSIYFENFIFITTLIKLFILNNKHITKDAKLFLIYYTYNKNTK